MFRPLNVATPLLAAIDVEPESVPPPGLAPSATLTVAEEVTIVFPSASWTATATAGVMAAPATVLLGWTVIASRAAAPAVMSNAALVAPVRPADDAASVYPAPTLSIDRLANVATPPTAARVRVPDSVPPPGLFPSATVTLAVELVRLPNAS